MEIIFIYIFFFQNCNINIPSWMYNSFFSAFPPRATNFRIPSVAPATVPCCSSIVLEHLSGTVSSDIHSIIDLSLAPERDRSRLMLEVLS